MIRFRSKCYNSHERLTLDNESACSCQFNLLCQHFTFKSYFFVFSSWFHVKMKRTFLATGFFLILPSTEWKIIWGGFRWNKLYRFLLFKIVRDIDGPLYSMLQESIVVIRETHQTANLNSRAFNVIDHRSGQFSRKFFKKSINIWNERPENIVTLSNVNHFKSQINKYLLET